MTLGLNALSALYAYAVNPSPAPVASTPTVVGASGISSTLPQIDTRVRIRPFASDYFGSSELLAPLKDTSNGVIFPYQPTLNIQQQVDYATMSMVHSNQDYLAYSRSPNVTVSISGKFTVQNQYEGRYAFAAIHFFRSASKMAFGMNDPNAGLPPPICLLTGHGEYMFNNARCILRNFTHNYDETIDTVKVEIGNGGSVRLPALFTIGIECVIQQTGRFMAQNFTMDKYKDGTILKDGYF